MAKLIPLCLLILFMDLIPSTLGWFNYSFRIPPRTIPYPPYLPKPMAHRPPRAIPVAQPPLPPPLVGPKPPHSHVMPPLPPTVMPPLPSYVGPKDPPKHQLLFPPPQTIVQLPSLPPLPSHTCPVDTIKLQPCINLLGGVSRIGISRYAKTVCCPMLRGITDFDAALCLCTGVKAKSLNINLVTPTVLGMLVGCGKHPPQGFQCPA